MENVKVKANSVIAVADTGILLVSALLRAKAKAEKVISKAKAKAISTAISKEVKAKVPVRAKAPRAAATRVEVSITKVTARSHRLNPHMLDILEIISSQPMQRLTW